MSPMKRTPPNGTAEQLAREICRQTRKRYAADEKTRIVIFGLRGSPLKSRLADEGAGDLAP